MDRRGSTPRQRPQTSRLSTKKEAYRLPETTASSSAPVAPLVKLRLPTLLGGPATTTEEDCGATSPRVAKRPVRAKSATMTRRPPSSGRVGPRPPVHAHRLLAASPRAANAQDDYCSNQDTSHTMATVSKPPETEQPPPTLDAFFKAHCFRDREAFRHITDAHGPLLAKSLYYDSTTPCDTAVDEAATSWKDCYVLAYTPETGRFRIRFLASGLEKRVHRVNLMLPSDNPLAFLQQRAIFFQENALIRDVCRVASSLHDTPLDGVHVLAQHWKERIVQRAIGALPRTKALLSTHGRLLSDALTSASDDYAVAMQKTSRFFHHQQALYPVAAAYAAHEATVRTPTPVVIPERSAPFSVLRQQLEQTYLFAQAWTLPLLKQVLTMSAAILHHVSFFYDIPSDYDVIASRPQPPFLLPDYLCLQHSTMAIAQETLRVDWRKEMIQLIQCSVEIAPIKDLSVVRRFVKYVDCLLSRDLTDLMAASSSGFWRLLLEPRCTQITRQASEIPMSTIRKRHVPLYYRPRLKPPILALTLILHAVPGSSRAVTLQPSLDEVEAAIVELIGTTTTSFLQQVRIESALIPDVAPLPLLHAGRATEVQRAMAETTSIMRRLFVEPLALVQRYQAFVLDLDSRICRLQSQLGADQSVFLHDDIFHAILDQLAWFTTTLATVSVSSFDGEAFGLLQVDSRHLKQVLYDQVHHVVQTTLHALAANCHIREGSITSAFEVDLTKLTTVPKTEVDVEAQCNYIHDLLGSVHERRLAVHTIDGRLDAIAGLGVRVHIALHKAIWARHWTLQQWPQRLHVAALRASEICDWKKLQLTEGLSKEKRRFESDIAELRNDIASFLESAVWAREKLDAVADRAHTLLERAETAVAQVHAFIAREKTFGSPLSKDVEVTSLLMRISPYARFWSMAAELVTSTHVWSKTPFSVLNGADVVAKVDAWRAQMAGARFEFQANPRIMASLDGLATELDAFSVGVPVVAMVASGSMKPRHWVQIVSLLPRHHAVTGVAQEKLLFTLEDLVDDGILSVLSATESVHNTAIAEFRLETTFLGLRRSWARPLFALDRYALKDTFVITNFSELLAEVDDQRLTLHGLVASPHVTSLLHDVLQWQDKLHFACELLTLWHAVQCRWRAVEGFFYRVTDTDIGRDVATMEKIWRSLSNIVRGQPSVARIVDSDNIKEPLEKCWRILEHATKAISAVLELQREAFPKLWLLPDDTLRDLLVAKDLASLVPCLQGLYDGLCNLESNESGSMTRLGLHGDDGFSFSAPIPWQWPVAEGWFEHLGAQLHSLDKAIHTAVHDAMTAAFASADALVSVAPVLTTVPLQVAVATLHFAWTQCMTRAIDAGGATDDVHRALQTLTKELLALLRTCPLKMAVLLTDVSALTDVTTKLHGATNDHFIWQAYPKHHQTTSGEYVLDVLQTSVAYRHDVVCHHRPRSAYTTEKAVFGLFLALRHGRGLLLQGDAATATARDLACLVGTTLALYTATPAASSWRHLGRLLLGAASTGSWLYITDLHALAAPVVAKLAHAVLQQSVARRAVDGRSANVHPHFVLLASVSAPMSTASTLSALFVPCALIPLPAPMATKRALFAHGFQHYEALSAWIGVFLDGLRVAKVLVAEITLAPWRLAQSAASHWSEISTLEAEGDAVFAALERIVMARLSMADAVVALQLLRRLAPVPSLAHSDAAVEYMASKMTQLQETTSAFLCSILFGAPVVGKSTLLAAAAHGQYDIVRLFPAEASTSLLEPFYGAGLQSSWLHDVVTKATVTGRRWIILDGPCDARLLDTVMAFLNDYQRVSLEASAVHRPWRIVLETDVVAGLSPSTAPSIGQIHLDATGFSWRHVLDNWLQRLPPSIARSHGKTLQDLGFWILPLACAVLPPKHPMAVASAHTMVSLLSLVDALVANGGWPTNSTAIAPLLEGCFVFGLIWCAGAALSPAHKETFNDLLRRAVVGDLPHHYRVLAAPIPSEKSVFDYMFDVAVGRWVPWPTATVTVDSTAIGVVGAASVRTAFFIKVWRPSYRPILLTGPSCSGKSYLLRHVYRSDNSQHYIPCAAAMPNLKRHIASKLGWVGERTLGHLQGLDHYVILDDLHVACTGVDCVRELVETQRWRFDSGDIRLRHVWFVGAMRSDDTRSTSQRLLRHFFHIALDPLTPDGIFAVCATSATPVLAPPVRDTVLRATSALVLDLLEHPATLHLGWNVLQKGLDILRIVGTLPPSTYANLGLSMLWAHEASREFEDALRATADITRFRASLIAALAVGFGPSSVAQLESTSRLNGLVFCPNARQPSQYDEIYRPQYVAECLSAWRLATKYPSTVHASRAVIACLAKLLRVLTLPLGVGPYVLIFFQHSAGRHDTPRQVAAIAGMASAIVGLEYCEATSTSIGTPASRRLVYVPPSVDASAVVATVLDAIRHGDGTDTPTHTTFLVLPMEANGDDDVRTLYPMLVSAPFLFQYAHIVWLDDDGGDCFDGNAAAIVARTTLAPTMSRHARSDALIAVCGEVQAHVERALRHAGASTRLASLSKYAFPEAVETLLSEHTARWLSKERIWTQALVQASILTNNIHALATATEHLLSTLGRLEARRTECISDLMARTAAAKQLDDHLDAHVASAASTAEACARRLAELTAALAPFEASANACGVLVLDLPHDDILDEAKPARLHGHWSQLHVVLQELLSHGRGRRRQSTVQGAASVDGRSGSVRDLVRNLLQVSMERMAHTSILSARQWRLSIADAKVFPTLQVVLDYLDALLAWAKVLYDKRRVSTQLVDDRHRLQVMELATPQHRVAQLQVRSELGMASADVEAHDIEMRAAEAQLTALRAKRAYEEAVRRRLDASMVRTQDQLASVPVVLGARLPGACVLAATIRVYLASCASCLRTSVLEYVTRHLETIHFACSVDEMLSLLFEERTLLPRWRLHGLPLTHSFTAAAFAIASSTKPVLLVDGNGIGEAWLTSLYGDNLLICDATETNLSRATTRALQTRKKLLVRNVEADLRSVLSKFAHVSGQVYVDGKIHAVHAEWRVYIQTPFVSGTQWDEAIYQAMDVVDVCLGPNDAPSYFQSLVATLWDESDHLRVKASWLTYYDAPSIDDALLPALAANASLDDVWHWLQADEVPEPPPAGLAPSTTSYMESLLPTLLFLFDASYYLLAVNCNYAVYWSVASIARLVEAAKHRWQVDTLRAEESKRDLLSLARPGLTQAFTKRQLLKRAQTRTQRFRDHTEPRDVADLHAHVLQSIATVDAIVSNDDAMTWRFLLAITSTRQFAPSLQLSDALLSDMARIWRGEVPWISSVDALRKPASMEKRTWAIVVTLSQHEGLRDLVTSAPSATEDANPIYSAWHRVVQATCCLSQNELHAAIAHFTAVALAPHGLPPLPLPYTMTQTVLQAALEATDSSTPILLFVDAAPSAVVTLSELGAPLSLLAVDEPPDVVRDALAQAAASDRLALVLLHKLLSHLPSLSLAWQEQRDQDKTSEKHRLMLCSSIHDPMSKAVLACHAHKRYLRPVVSLADALGAHPSPTTDDDNDTVRVRLCTLHVVLLRQQHVFFAPVVPVDASALAMAMRDVLAAPPNTSSATRFAIGVAVYHSYVPDADRLQVICDWLQCSEGRGIDESEVPTPGAAFSNTQRGLVEVYGDTLRHVCPPLERNDEASVKELQSLSHAISLHYTFHDVLSLATWHEHQRTRSPWTNFFFAEVAAFGVLVTRLQRDIATYLADVPSHRSTVQQLLAGYAFPLAWRVLPRLQLTSVEAFVAHMKQRRRCLEVYKDGSNESEFWLPAFARPKRLVELLLYQHVPKRARFVLGDELTRGASIADRFARRLLKKPMTDETRHSTALTGIRAYNASWHPTARQLRRPEALGTASDLPSVHVVYVDDDENRAALVDLVELPVHHVDSTKDPIVSSVILRVVVRLPDDPIDRAWLLAHAFLHVG
ncbi:hypothetical protein SDRG_00412 [Saprolegnia diclina VS20]|uniref:Dynein heavy chain linker domain-containing protein n=1 Tax=Saprolegnia diclina (strain VS20) TaxID=1156394 RepID=T0QWS0_SAPDV|nr:hypothetical protein SDRG_00412 [Saprolegnia diclina VS20]EQC42684.1 hypothetical protein SDRG_00412 [Saprolegnia diclina VS20]|eukprot:XP_008604107.1 hypothetical protein SDRG_00412 [Saprolegnia diclina VS20]